MGGKSTSASTTSQTTTNQQNIATTSIGFENVDGGVIYGSSVTLSDQGAIDAGRDLAELGLDSASDIADSSFGLAGESIQQAGRNVESVLDFADDFGSDSYEFATGALERSLAFTEAERERSADAQQGALRSLGQAITQVSDASRSDSADTLRRIGVPLVIVLGVGFVALAFFNRRS